MEQRETAAAGSQNPPAKKLKAHWKCAKCGFATASETEFQEHIPRHKADSSTSQCLLCGLCYTSQISLNRHLFIVHKVKDPEEEEEEQEDEKEAVAMETSENGPMQPNGEVNVAEEGGDNTKSKDSGSDRGSCSTGRSNCQNKRSKTPNV